MYRGGASASALILLIAATILCGCASSNTPPEIVSLEYRARVVWPGDSVLVECVASDPDGDTLDYRWTSDRGAVNGYSGVVAWTAPAEEGLARLTVTVSDGGEETASRTIVFVVKRNTAPLLDGVVAARPWVRPGESVAVSCNAEDADGDQLNYSWSAACGQISGGGPAITWTAPDAEGECVLTVVVDDGYDGTASGSTAIAISALEPLLVTGMTVTAVDNPPYLVARTDWYKVYWTDSYVIECAVTEPGRVVSYEWSDGGPTAVFPVAAEHIAFEGGPATIRWTAPKKRGEYILTVTARDELGNGASKSITLFVESCTCGFPNG